MINLYIIIIYNSAIIIIGGVMRRKKVKIHYGNLFILILFVGIVCMGGYFLMDHFIFNNTSSEKSDSEVIKTLTNLGYSKNDASKIESNLSKDDVNKIDKKYDNLALLSSVKYFHIENIERYEKLMSENKYDVNEVVMRVNTGIDRDFYTDIKIAINPDDLHVLVNKYHGLSEDYEPSDLISVGNNQRMKREAGEQLIKMLKDINDSGLYLQAQSGYRSISFQSDLYNGYVKKDGVQKTDTYSARPGHSEHHTGLAIDVSQDGTLDKSFENTSQFRWLKENAHKYGFILRYPKDKIYMTGYDYEPWHYRYVGVEEATLIHTEGITYEEYCVKYLGLY